MQVPFWGFCCLSYSDWAALEVLETEEWCDHVRFIEKQIYNTFPIHVYKVRTNTSKNWKTFPLNSLDMTPNLK